MRLLLVRHGETEWNSEQRYIGRTDLPLSEKGLQQAQALARRLKDEAVDVVYTSDYQRASQTAAAIADALRMPAQEDARLRELDFGRWEGLTLADIQERYAETYANWIEDPQASPPGGESLAHLQDRVSSLLGELLISHPDDTVALVSHGGTFQILLLVALDIPLRNGWYFYMYNGALSELIFHDSRAALVYLNDIHHLA
jgi:alpha-ribazole phosphatase